MICVKDIAEIIYLNDRWQSSNYKYSKMPDLQKNKIVAKMYWNVAFINLITYLVYPHMEVENLMVRFLSNL